MKKLLSLPPDIARRLSALEPSCADSDWFAGCDPADRQLGSGGGLVWLLDCEAQSRGSNDADTQKRIIIHAGGQSRRLPAYSAVGKVLTPIPVMRWALGERIDQNLLSMQLPFYQQLMEATPAQLNTLVASGDVYIRANAAAVQMPADADVVCFGIWAEPSRASHHGVFVSRRSSADRLDFMLQKPSVEQLARLNSSHFYLMDTGLWILSDKAIERLRAKSTDADGRLTFYDLYGAFGCALGDNPSSPDPELADLKVAVVTLENSEFYHFGTSRELLSSTWAMQTKVADQRLIIHRNTKAAPALYTQNCLMDIRLTADNANVWVENSHVARGWELSSENIITGVPRNDWQLQLPAGACIDIVPVDESAFAVRPYGFDDPMRGDTLAADTLFLGHPLVDWAAERSVDIPVGPDIHSAPLFPVVDSVEKAGIAARWMISEPQLEEGKQLWLNAEKLSAAQLSARASLERLYRQRREFLRLNIPMLASNYANSVYYQLDLDDLAHKYVDMQLDMPAVPPVEASDRECRMRCHQLRSRIASLRGADGSVDKQAAFGLLSEELLEGLGHNFARPRLDVLPDQIVWSRSPVRIDFAGGWTDTPPYCIFRGGTVVNAAIELNSQPPLQVFVKPSAEPVITLRSIDLGASERITTFEQLLDYRKVGSPFSLPKAALTLAGFAPGFSADCRPTLRSQLEDFGAGIEITLLSAVPAGSGLGTSSILGATILGALNNFCSLAWDTSQLCSHTHLLEQMLTTGGGWQDQYGGVLGGVKLLESTAGKLQRPTVNWLPEALFNDPQYAPCHLLYYTGITRTAKHILAEIVQRMFLNSRPELAILDGMRQHAMNLAEAIQRCDFNSFGALIGKSWSMNKVLDSGVNPPAVEAIIRQISDLTLGLKLPGAGGGGFLYMVAKDPEAAARIRHILNTNPPNDCARFVDMRLSSTGLRTSRS